MRHIILVKPAPHDDVVLVFMLNLSKFEEIKLSERFCFSFVTIV
jgi:hypothetical protein